MIDALLYSTIFVYETVKYQFTEVQFWRKHIFHFFFFFFFFFMDGLFKASVSK